MKRCVVTVLASIFLCSLLAQTQTLPEIRVSGESDIRAYLYKRSLLFSPLMSVQDSLPAIIPSGKVEHSKSTRPASIPKKGFLQLEANAGFGLNSYLSIYPQASSFHSISHHMNLRAPETSLMSFQNYLVVSGELIPYLPVVFKIDHTNTKASNYKGSYFESTLVHHRAGLDLGYFRMNELMLGIGLSNLRQDVYNSSFNKDYFDVSFSERLTVGSLDIKTKVISQAGETGIQIAPLLKEEAYNLSGIRLHVLADAYRLIPSLEFHYRHQLSDSGVFSFSNIPRLESNSFTSLLERGPWIQFSDAHCLQKTPVNLRTALEYRYPQTNEFSLRSFTISNSTRYDVHSPLLTASTTYGVPTIDYTDVASSQTAVEAFFAVKDFSFYQDVVVDLAYLPNQSMHRVGYKPILSLNTNADYRYRGWTYSVDISQNYFSKDHTGRNMSEAINANVGFEYRKANSALYAQLSNIFNHRHWVFTEHPSQKRNIFLGLKHRF
jgi:hypothetical protein